MAPTPRNSTRQKTTASAKAAKDAGFSPRPLTRKQRYTRTKGLVSWKTSKNTNDITITNAAASPLLSLPAEIRHVIFKYASRPTEGCVELYYNRFGHVSRRGLSTYGKKSELKDIAIRLPGVCRQIYAETATLVYSESCFVFQSEDTMDMWLSKRLLGQREAIRWIMLPGYLRWRKVAGAWRQECCREEIAERVRKTCPKLVEMERCDWLRKEFISLQLRDEELCASWPSSSDNSE